MTNAATSDAVPIPASHVDLLTRPICGVFSTMGRDGYPQSSLVWVDIGGGCALVNTAFERQKGRNLLADPKVSLLVVDPDDATRFMQVRGDAELITDGALGRLDALLAKYAGHLPRHGHAATQGSCERQVIYRIRARSVTLDAIHASAERAGP